MFLFSFACFFTDGYCFALPPIPSFGVQWVPKIFEKKGPNQIIIERLWNEHGEMTSSCSNRLKLLQNLCMVVKVSVTLLGVFHSTAKNSCEPAW